MLDLNARSLELNAKAEGLFESLTNDWNQIDAFFNDIRVFQPVEFQLPDDGEGEDRYLGIKKIKSKWRVSYASRPCNTNDELVWTAITEKTVDVRLRMLDYLGQLHEKLVESNEAFIPKLECAVKKARSFLASVGVNNPDS